MERTNRSDEGELALAMDERGIRLVGDSAGDDEARVWVVPVETGPTSIVKPSPSGQFGLPTDLESQPFRLFAQRLSARGTVLECERTWTRKDVEGATVVFRRAAACRLRVTCRDDLGAPVDATIKVERVLGTDLVTVLASDTDRSGALEAAIEGPGRYQVTPIIRAASDAPQAARQEVDLDAQRTGLVSFVVQRSAHLIVSVREEDGSPTSKAQLDFKRRTDGWWQPIPASGSVDGEGNRVTPKLPPGDYLLQCIAPRREPVVSEFTLAAGEERRITVPMRPGGMGVRGRIQAPSFDLHSADALGKCVFLLRRDTDARYVFAFWTVDVQRGGTFSASGLLAGEYELRVFEGEWFAHNVRVDQPDQDLGTIVVSRELMAGDRAIELSLDTPAPPAMSFTALVRSDSWPSGIARTVTISRSTSPIVIDGLRPGRYRVELSPAGVDPLTFDIGHTETVELAEAEKSIGRVKLRVPQR